GGRRRLGTQAGQPGRHASARGEVLHDGSRIVANDERVVAGLVHLDRRRAKPLDADGRIRAAFGAFAGDGHGRTLFVANWFARAAVRDRRWGRRGGRRLFRGNWRRGRL